MLPEFEQMLAQGRAELEVNAPAGDRVEVKSHADTLPVILYYDPRWVSPSLRELPDIVRGRLASRPHLLTVPATDEILGEHNLLTSLELTQFGKQGYHIHFAAFRPFLTPTRGRRPRDPDVA